MKIKNFLKNKIINFLYSYPFLQRPFPKNPFGYKPLSNKNNYLKLYRKAIKKKYKRIDLFEKDSGFSIDKIWFNELCLITQTCIKKSDLNFNHGRILYSLLSKYIFSRKDLDNNNLTIFETGTARGFSSICMSKAINDRNASGKIITLDCISHNEKIYWNSISDHEGKKNRSELLKKWKYELSNIIFIQGWTLDILNRIGVERINFAFLDAQHTKNSVIKEFKYICKRQIKGDIVFFDDVTPNLFDGVCEAVKEVETKYPYKIERLNFDNNRSYAIAIKTK